MTVRHGRLALPALAIVATLWSLLSAPAFSAAESSLSRLSDREFWSMVERFSEPDRAFRSSGAVRSDNLISNEAGFQLVIPALRNAGLRGAYLGVGPEQNFTYIVALKPTIGFIVDVRRGNMLLHLMYKAIIEMSSDRVDLLCYLFARPRPAGLGPDSEVPALFEAFRMVSGSEDLGKANLRAIIDRLERVHGFRLSREDEGTIKDAYDSFRLGGPDIRWDSSGDPWIPSYADLMTQADSQGVSRSYLASEENFRVLKDYETKNRIVPLVGDFAGDKTLRAVGRYLKDHHVPVAAFYTSNVEGYLFQGRRWQAFLMNVSMLPTVSRSSFIRTHFQLIGYVGDRPEYKTRTVLDPIRESLRVLSPQ